MRSFLPPWRGKMPKGQMRGIMKQPYSKQMRNRARDLRSHATAQEALLWNYLRAKRLGVKFRRQVPIGNYIVDFACLEKHLIIEVDGSQHAENKGGYNSYSLFRTMRLSGTSFLE